MPSYKVNNEIFTIKDEEVDLFENDFPDAELQYQTNDGESFTISAKERKDFLTDFPDAKAIDWEIPDNSFEEAETQQAPRRGFKAGMQESWKGLKAGTQFAYGEVVNGIFGSSQDDANALYELNEMLRQGKDVASEVEGAWTDAGREIRTGALEFLPGWAIKGLKDRVYKEAEHQKVLDDIREVLGETNGDVAKARQILEERAMDLSHGDKVKLDAQRQFGNIRETEGFGAWLGENTVQMIPSASALIVGALTKIPAAARAIGMIGMGGMTAATSGSSMYEARQAGASDLETHKVGVVDGAIEYITEKLPFDNYTNWMVGKTKGKVATEVARALRSKNSPVRAEMEELLTMANKELGGKLFSKKNAAAYIADMVAEGASEFTAEASQTMTRLMYDNPDLFPLLGEALANGWQGALAGFFMGGVLGGASKTMEHHQNRERRQKQGYVDVALVNFGTAENPDNDIVEVISVSEDTDLAQVLRDGAIINVNKNAIGQQYRYSYEAFEAGRMRVLESEALDNESVTQGMIQAADSREATAEQNLVEALRASGMADDEIMTLLDDADADKIRMFESPDIENAYNIYRDARHRARELRRTSARQAQSALNLKKLSIEENAGQFWRDNQTEDANGNPIFNPTVETGLMQDGTRVYVLSDVNEQGECAAVTENGEKKIIKADMLQDGTQVFTLDEYLQSLVDADKVQQEQTRMVEQTQDRMTQARQAAQPGTQINLGTEEDPVIGSVVEQGPDGVIVQSEAGASQLTWDEYANAMHIGAPVLTDSETAGMEAAEILSAESAYNNEVAQTESEAKEVADESGAALQEFEQADPLPRDAEGNVDETTLWNDSPARWAEWNDEQRQDGGANSVQAIDAAIAKLSATITEQQAAYGAMPVGKERNAVEQEIASLQERLAELLNVQQRYVVPVAEEVTETAAEAPAAEVAEEPAVEAANPVRETLTQLYNDPELSESEIEAFINANVQESQKALDKHLDKAPKVGTDMAKYKAERAKHQAKTAELEKQRDFWREVQSYIEMPDVTAMDMEPQNALEFTANELTRKDGVKLQRDSFTRHTGYGSEAGNFLSMLRTKQNGGLTLEEAGERLMEMDRENGTRFFDQSDPNAGLNAILEVIGGARTSGDVSGYIKANREQLAREEMAAARNAMMEEMTQQETAPAENIADNIESDLPEDIFMRTVDETEAIDGAATVRERAKAWEKRLGVKVNVLEDVSQVNHRAARNAINRGVKPPGWFDPDTGEVCIFAPYVPNLSEVDKTVIHEVISHKGLRGLLGEEGFNALCDYVWQNMKPEARAKYLTYEGVLNGERKTEYLANPEAFTPTEKESRAAADEFIAGYSESMNTDKNAWRKMIDSVKRFINKLTGNYSLLDQLDELLEASLARYETIAKMDLQGVVEEGQTYGGIINAETGAKIDASSDIQAEGNIEQISGGLLGQQDAGSFGSSRRGTRTGETGEGAEVISEDQLDAPNSGEPQQITAADGEVIADTNGKGEVRFSIRTWLEGGRDYLSTWLAKDSTLADDEKADILARMDEFYQNAVLYSDTYVPFGTWSEAGVRYDNNGNPLMSVIKANGDYSMNLDFSLVCKKRRPLNRLLRTLINRNAFGTYSLKEREIAEINWILQEHGFEVACALCFVDAKRYRVSGVADVFAALYNRLVKAIAPQGVKIAHFNYSNNPNVEAVEGGIDTLPDEQLDWKRLDNILKGYKKGSVEHKVAQFLRNHPEQRKLVDATDFIEAEGFESVKEANPELLKLYNSKKGTGGPKASFGDVQYLNDILKNEKSFSAEKAYAVGGVRLQSFSDFVPHMYFDYMQLFAELAAKKLPVHAYTKEVLFAKIFGLTGAKINLSLVPAVVEGGIAPGLDAEGNYVWADAVKDTEGNIIQQGQTFPFDEAMAIQNAEGYSKNCGAIAVGISDEHIEKMLDDPNIQFIIPYHKSSLNAIVARMTNIDQYKDYTNVQNTKKASGSKLDKGTKDFNFNEYLHNLGENGTPQQAAQAYLDWCKENRFVPKFSQFAYHPNYYKLLVDFNTIDTTTGEYSAQGPVTMTFPTEQSAFGNVETLIQQGLQEDEALEEKMETEIDSVADEVETRLAEIAKEPAMSEKQKAARMAELADERTAKIKAKAEGEDVSFRITPEMDAEYLRAVEAGDMETAQRMVDEAAAAAGYTIRGDHGRVSKFTIFDRNKANPEGNWGQGFYFTNNEEDVENNYATVDGPDLEAKIEREVERRVNLAEMNEEFNEDGEVDEFAIREAVEDEFITSEPNVVHAAIKMDNPFVVGHGMVEIGEDGLGHYDMQETYLTAEYETDEDGETDFSVDPTGTLVDLVEALNEELSEYEWANVNAYDILANNPDGMTAGQFEKEAREFLSPHIDYLVNDNGEIMSSEIIRAAIERAGFDGIVDNTVNQKFGTARRYGQSMEGMDSDTRHYIAFQPSQIKQTDPVTYDDDGNIIPLSQRFNPENEDIRFRVANENQAIFVSNAAKAVEGIKQEKATPEQWLKMIEKNGGLKAGEGMKGFYDKMLPAFMNKYGKKWGVKVEDIVLPSLENGLTMHSVPVTEEMKASVMEGQVMFRVRGENESAVDFCLACADDVRAKYRIDAKMRVAEVNEKNAKILGYKDGEITDQAIYLPEYNMIIIFAHEDWENGLDIECAIFHEIIHKYEDPAVGEWLWNHSDGVQLLTDLKGSIIERYPEDEFSDEDRFNELLCDSLSIAMTSGTAQKFYDSLPDEHKITVDNILNEIRYDRERESTERVRRSAGESSIGESGAESISGEKGPEAGGQSGIQETNRETAEGGAGRSYQESEMAEADSVSEASGEGESQAQEADSEGLSFRVTDITPEVRAEMNTISAIALVNGTYLKAPNGADTNLTPEQWALVRTKNFLRWFGDWINDPENASKVVDENGEPMVVYHGGSSTFNRFDTSLGDGIRFRTREEAQELLNLMQENAETLIPRQLTEDIWKEEIEGRTFSSPIGTVRLGLNQFDKNINKGRAREFGMLIPTIERPDLIFEESAPEEGAERQTKYVFVKTFIDESGAKHINYASISVQKEGMEVVESSHRLRDKQVLNKIEKEQMLWNRFASDSTSSAPGISTDQSNALSDSKDNDYLDTSNDLDENISYRITGTPTEQVVAEGVSLSPADMARVAGRIFSVLPEEARREVTASLNGNILGLQDAIMQIPARLAMKQDWDEQDMTVAETIASEMDRFTPDKTRPFSTYEGLWMLYDALTPASSLNLMDQASRAIVKRNLGVDEATLERMKGYDDDVRFRTVGDASINAEASLYNKGASNVWTRLKESFVDMNASVEQLVKAIEKKTGMKAQGFENILNALNQQSSKGLAAMKGYTRKYLKPMFKAIREIMDNTKFKYEDIVRYVILKHGLERNKKLAQRDARAHYQEIYDDIITKIKGMSDAQKRTYLTNAQLRDADAKAELATLQNVNTSILTDEQKREHKRDLAKARKAAEEAAEYLERAKKIASLSEQEAQDELDKIFENIENGTDSVYQELRKNDYSGISSMFYDQLGVNRKDYSTEEQYQSALMLAKNDKYSTLADVEAAAEAEVKKFEGTVSTKDLWEKINAATKETLRQQYEANMISKDQYESLRNMFEYYVPLRGFKDNTAEDMYTYYRKPNSTGYTKPILGAEGRKTEAESPFGWIAAMAGSAVASNVKNQAKLALYYFVSNRPENGIATLSRTWFVDSGEVDADGKKIFKPAYPPFTEDLSSDAAKASYEAWQENMRELQKKGQAYESGQRLNLGNAVVNISDANKPEHIVNVKVAGKDYTILINGNPRAAQAINGQLNIEASAQDYTALFGPVLRWMSSVNTSYNPEFWITNMMRDMLFTFMSVNTKEDAAYRRKFAKNYLKAFKVVKMVHQNEKGTIGDSYLENMYKEFEKNGGVTGHTQIKGSEEWEKEIAKQLASEDPEGKKAGKMMRKVKDVFSWFHQTGESLEQVSRFAAFLTAREMGKPMSEAIDDAKEITVNFNRKGSGKRITLEEARYLTDKNGQPLNAFQQWLAVGLSSIAPLGRRTIMFFNAAMQGLNATAKLVKKNPQKMAAWSLAYFAIGVMNAVLHNMFDDDDDYLDMPEYERRNALMVGGNGVYFKWALPQEMRMIYGLGDLAVEAILGRNPHESTLAEAVKIVTEVLPINPTEGWRAFLPSIAIPFVELGVNEDYKGDPIYNEQKWLSEGEKERTAKWSSAYKSTGRVYIEIAKALNSITGGDEYDAGLVNLQPEKLEYLVQSAFGGTIRTADKFVSSVINAIDPEESMTVRQSPFLNRVLTLNDERYKNVHVNDVFEWYENEVLHAISLEKQFKRDKQTEKLEELKASDEYKWIAIYKEYEKDLKLKKAQLKAAPDTRTRMELTKAQDEIKKKVIKEISALQ